MPDGTPIHTITSSTKGPADRPPPGPVLVGYMLGMVDCNVEASDGTTVPGHRPGPMAVYGPAEPGEAPR